MDERYPIGKFSPQAFYTPQEIASHIDLIEKLPELLHAEIQSLSDEQLDTPYREGGWTVRQVVHHLADSHLNAYIRLKWTLTEASPVIKAYDEKAWAETPETQAEPALSITFLTALHHKWVSLLRQLSDSDIAREFIHPETKKNQRIDRMIALYAWHGVHHLAHISNLKKKREWK
ncbi:MAG TPA: putative metal-dependent hydrolase [Cyclobacteriaceae bacterium]